MTIAGMPPVPLPGQYVAALISEVVSPCNWMLAAIKAPDSFDALDATGLLEEQEVKPMKYEQMMALVMVYGSSYEHEPANQRLPNEMVQQVEAANESNKVKAMN